MANQPNSEELSGHEGEAGENENMLHAGIAARLTGCNSLSLFDREKRHQSPQQKGDLP
jgi:hypothetical protein